MANFLHDIGQIRQINWGAKHLWDIMFEGAPAPFNTWFPASDIEIQEAALDTYTIEAYDRTFEIPSGTMQLELRTTIYDDENFTLYKWIRNWINNEILNKDKPEPYISRLENIVKSVHLLKLNSRKEVLETRSFLVYPKLVLAWEGSSVPDAQQYSIPFVIAGSSKLK